jgi:ATP-dependent DNA helicase RecG
VLTGSLKGRARADALASIADGSAGIVVGTHALLEENVDFADLGLAVIDEQHRFGVEQRARLGERENGGRRPHVLVMTATPIPRTVVMAVFGDLDVSTLTDLPQGRAEVTTHVVDPSTQPKHYERVWDRVAEEAAQGNRVFVVCPRIGEGLDSPSEQPADMEPADMEEGESGMHGVIEFASWLATRCPNLRIGTLHGRMSSDEKEAVMTRFRGTQSDALDVLVATTVIEVGVDVPQASMMVVMDAERFGISQLHQLRGRIGRGSIPGVCILVSRGQGVTRTRLDAVAATRDGFVLAQHDVELRGAGDVLGAAQSGLKSSLRLLDVLHDVDVIRDARGVAESLIGDDPELSGFDTLRVALDRADTERLAFLERA